MAETTRPGDEDRLLAEASQRGDIASFGVLFQRYRPSMIARSRTILRDADAAEDAVQETFLRAWRGFATFDTERSVWPWLVAIVERVSIDALRRSAAGGTRAGGREIIDAAATDPNQTFRTVHAREAMSQMRSALDSLPGRQRDALLLRAVEGWSHVRIAAEVRSSPASVKSLIARARASLRQSMGAMLPSFLAARFRGVERRLARFGDRVRGAAAQLGGDASGALSGFATGVVALALALNGAPGAAEIVPGPSKAAMPEAVVAAAATREAVAPSTRPSGSRPASPPKKPSGGLLGTGRYTPEENGLREMTVSPSYEDDHTVFGIGTTCDAACHPILFVSRDGGASWSARPSVGFTGERLLIPPTYPRDDRIFSVGNTALQVSEDGGASFRVVSPLAYDAAMSPRFGASDDRILLVHQGLFWYHADSGLTVPASITPSRSYIWTALPDSPTVPEFSIRGVQTDDGIVAEIVSGTRIRRVELDGYVVGARFSPAFATDGTIYLWTIHRAYRSTDRGASFTPIAFPWRHGSGSVHPIAGGFLVARGGTRAPWGVYRYTRGVWDHVEIPLPAFRLGPAAVVLLPDGRMIATGLFGGVACTDGWGRPWKARCAPAD